MKHILTGAIIGAILGLLGAIVGSLIGALIGLLIEILTGAGKVASTGVSEVAGTSAVLGAIVGAAVGALAKRIVEAERRKAEPKYKAKSHTLNVSIHNYKPKHKAKSPRLNVSIYNYEPEHKTKSPRLNVSVHNYKALPKAKAPAGYVYVIQDVSHTRQYKIGRTNHPASRLNRFGVELPIKTEVIAILRTDDDKELERRLHQKYAGGRARGEWFALDAAQIDEIRRM